MFNYNQLEEITITQNLLDDCEVEKAQFKWESQEEENQLLVKLMLLT